VPALFSGFIALIYIINVLCKKILKKIILLDFNLNRTLEESLGNEVKITERRREFLGTGLGQ